MATNLILPFQLPTYVEALQHNMTIKVTGTLKMNPNLSSIFKIHASTVFQDILLTKTSLMYFNVPSGIFNHRGSFWRYSHCAHINDAVYCPRLCGNCPYIKCILCTSYETLNATRTNHGGSFWICHHCSHVNYSGYCPQLCGNCCHSKCCFCTSHNTKAINIMV